MRAGRQCIEKSASNSSLSTHYIIIDSSCLGLVHLLFFFLIFFSDLWQAAECWMEVYSAAVPAAPLTALSLFSLYWSSYLPIICRLTFDNIMWNRSGDSANETAWWMLLSTALTLLRVVSRNALSHMQACRPVSRQSFQKEWSMQWIGPQACILKE